jgi:hypothetical protein
MLLLWTCAAQATKDCNRRWPWGVGKFCSSLSCFDESARPPASALRAAQRVESFLRGSCAAQAFALTRGVFAASLGRLSRLPGQRVQSVLVCVCACVCEECDGIYVVVYSE